MRAPLVLVLLSAAAAARLAAGCGGSDAAAPPPLDGSSPEGSSSSSSGSGGPGGDATTDADAPLPSFCDGLVLYASFDAAFRAELGGGDPLAHGTARLVPQGRFGGGLELAADAGDPEGGAALYFVTPDGGAAVFPDAEGTLAMWARRSDDAGSSPVLYRPVSAVPPAPLGPTGLTLVETSNSFGLVHTPGGATRPLHTFPTAQVRPYLRDGDYNQYVTAWRRGDASGPTGYLVINGGTGERFDDAGPDASDPYRDAAPTEAGSLRVPYRGYTSAKWDDDAGATALRLSAPTGSSTLQGTVDDLAVWSRVLSFAEIEAVYRIGQPIGDVCRLR